MEVFVKITTDLRGADRDVMAVLAKELLNVYIDLKRIILFYDINKGRVLASDILTDDRSNFTAINDENGFKLTSADVTCSWGVTGLQKPKNHAEPRTRKAIKQSSRAGAGERNAKRPARKIAA